MNPGRHRLWWAFWGGVVLVVAALSWASMSVYSLEQHNAVTRAENQRQEVIRLALWRMDSRLAPIIALEASRPIEDYKSLIEFEYSAQNQPAWKNGVEARDYNQGFFEIDELGRSKGSDERVTKIASLSQVQKKEQTQKDSVARRFDDLQRSSDTADREPQSPMVTSQTEAVMASAPSKPEGKGDYEARQEIANIAQSNRALSVGNIESEALSEEVDAGLAGDNQDKLPQDSDLSFDSTNTFDSVFLKQSGVVASPATVIGGIEPRWVAQADGTQELVLVRTIRRNGLSVVQGVWLDWNAMAVELVASIDDLLPASTLQPYTGEAHYSGKKPRQSSYRLATVPVSFLPGGATAVEGGSWTPAMIAMLVTWIAVLLAMVAVGMVLKTVLNLSARRGRFVGAVTHELRTPLTTFRLYSQMLADGMVTDEAVQKEYLNTLKRESDRLTGIVENVLEYARITRKRHGRDKPKGEQCFSVGELMARIVPPMSRLGEQSGMDLVVSDETSDDAERTVTLDPHAVERIVMNLMDNACKYAGGQSDEGDSDLRVHLDASVSNESLSLVVSDHGPGVPSRDRRKIFGEFVRGSSGTMRDRSGLGLGLALSRGLAIELGGDLVLVTRRGHGAEFELCIPLDSE